MSLSSKQRLRVLASYRGRGRANSNLWLVYSVKTSRDWMLHSDRELVYWLSYLETNPAVAWFSFDDENSAGGDEARQITVNFTGARASVLLRNRPSVTSPEELVGPTSEFTPTADVVLPGMSELSSDQLKQRVPSAMRWLKAISFAAAIRDMELTNESAALVSALRARGAGVLADIEADLAAFDPPTVYGLVVRMSIAGSLTLDLSHHPFCEATKWTTPDRELHVVT
ncbi:hypothetical protein SAMN05216204_12168 [Massilia yuzhufengensis]|jgi:hypothetical protein|uniref:TnsA endonuclease N terminal n=2 Tax=Massilia yuzhufengensis TaxID=1164594 RepID=A0A1I1RFS7_9BURK|nr:hypothetical protein SAMN05216204_12168 [Massilia yuzhufengensis]